MGRHDFIFKKLSYLLLKFAFSVHNLLGQGLLESAYEKLFYNSFSQVRSVSNFRKPVLYSTGKKCIRFTTRANILAPILQTL